MTIARSPDRNTFQKNNYIKRALEKGKTLDDPEVKAMIKFYEDWDAKEAADETDPDWQQQNLEYDMRSTPWFVAKVRASEGYAQNVYAALCNMRWLKAEVVPILKEEYWSCTWRSAGGIVADLRGEGDYIDWYCSGIRNTTYDEEDGKAWDAKGFVPEGVVTDEVAVDLRSLGWIHSEWPED